jgi:DNA-binding MarR family transcriptional regulator
VLGGVGAVEQHRVGPVLAFDGVAAVARVPDEGVDRLGCEGGCRDHVVAAEHLTISRGGLTKLADRLENAGLIRREPADTDGRGLYAVLTAEGNTLLRRMWPVYSRALRETFVSAISNQEAALIAAALSRVKEPRERAAPANKGLRARPR